MENKSHALAAGLFVLALFGMLIGLAAWLTSDRTERDVYELSTHEPVSGLQEQAAVRFRGVTVGKVTRISFDDRKTGNVLVRLEVDKNTPITRATFARLDFQGVTGLSFVQLDNEGHSDEALRSEGGRPPRIPLRSGLLGEFTDHAKVLMNQMSEATSRANALLDEDNRQALIGTVTDLGAAARDIAAAARSVQQLSAETRATIAAQLGPSQTSIPQLVAQATRTLKSFEDVAVQARSAVGDLQQVSASLQTGMAQMTAPGGLVHSLDDSARALSAQTLPGIQRAVRQAGSAMRNVDRAAASFSENPQVLLFGHGALPPGPGEPGFAAAP
ncbi:MAG: MlaD family protein [Ottowia sp.]